MKLGGDAAMEPWRKFADLKCVEIKGNGFAVHTHEEDAQAEALATNDQITVEPVVLPTGENTHHADIYENDDLPLNQEIVVATSNLPMLTREEDAEIAALSSELQPSHVPVAPPAQEEGQKRKEPKPSALTTRASRPPLKRPDPGLPQRSLSWNSSSEESTEGEDDSNNEVESARQANQEITHEQLTEETVLPANDQPSTLPQESAQAEEVVNMIEVEETVEPLPNDGEEAEALPVPTDDHTLQINVDAELARQIAQEEILDEIPSREQILRNELKRMHDWQKWRMSKHEIIATTINMIERESADKGILEKVKAISRHQSVVRDLRPGVGTSHTKEVPENSTHSSEQAEDDQSSAKEVSGGDTQVLHTSSDDDNESSDNQPTRPNDAPIEDAHESNHDSSESSSSNDSSGGQNDTQRETNQP
nr:hypothetical protein Iba_chr12aCG10560 [Ipomoea batatas]